MKNKNIIKFLNKYWLSRNVHFGEKIHNLKPANFQEWVLFLKNNNWFLISKLSKYGFKNYEHDYWIYYLKHSFWKLYISETKAMNFFKNKFNIKLNFAERKLDLKYGIDFYFNNNCFLIVKTSAWDDELKNLINYKDLSNFNYKNFNNTNSKIFVFISQTEKLHFFDNISNSFVLIENVD